jgi:TatD DNase family protein
VIDTHVHLDDDKLRGEAAAVVQRAQAAGVERMISIATTFNSARQCVELAQTLSGVFASVGIHPNYGEEAQPGDWDGVVQLVDASRVVALGETGLDRYWDNTPFPLQQDYFSRHLEMSRKTGLPVVIHCREADADMLAMLKEEYQKQGPLRGVMHSFSGSAPFGDACLEMGLYLSFSGVVTYKNADQLRSYASQVPADRILVETDAPYLTPVPLRGVIKKNEPAHVMHTAQCIADARKITLQQLDAITTANAQRLFSRLQLA